MPYSILAAQGHVPTEKDNVTFVKFVAKPDPETTHHALVDQGVALGNHLFSLLPTTSLVAMVAQIEKRQRQARNLKSLGLVP